MFPLAQHSTVQHSTVQYSTAQYSNRSKKTQKCATPGCASCASFLFLLHFDVTCDLSLNRRMVTWNLFVKSEFGKKICLNHRVNLTTHYSRMHYNSKKTTSNYTVIIYEFGLKI